MVILLQILLITPVFASYSVVPTSFCDPTPGWPRSFSEDFNGTNLNASRWTVYLENSNGQCGFGVGRYGKCVDENVYLDGNGALVIKTDKKSSCSTGAGCFNYTSGGVISRGKVDWSVDGGAGYRLCVRAMLPGGDAPGAGAGIWPAHWLMPEAVKDSRTQGSMCDPDGGEIDILEMVQGNGQACGTYHWQTTWPNQNCTYPKGHQSVHKCSALPSNWGSTYHEFAVEHTEHYLAFVVDGVTMVNTTTAEKTEFSDLPFFLILNTAVGGKGTWASAPNAATKFPTYHKIDYVRSSSKAAQ
jgi:beta-glucanase (GH16 family)